MINAFGCIGGFVKNQKLIYSILLIVTAFSYNKVIAEPYPIASRAPSPQELAAQNAARISAEETGNATPSSSSYQAPSITDQAKTTSSNENLGSLISLGMSAKLGFDGYTHISTSGCPATPCSWGTFSRGMAEVGFGALALLQSQAHGGTADFSAGNANYTSGNGSSSGTGTGSTTSETSNSNSNANVMGASINSGKAIEAYGIKTGTKIDPLKKTITFKNGKSYKFSDFSSKEAMEKAGFPSAAISGALASAKIAEEQALKEASKKAGKLNANLEADGGSGGASGFGGAGAGSEDVMMGGLGGSHNGKMHDPSLREPTSVAGMSKTFNGEPIGVSADDIFKMMNRRYEVKKTQDSFMNEAAISNK